MSEHCDKTKKQSDAIELDHALKCLSSIQSSAELPPIAAGQHWPDINTGQPRIRNSENTEWIDIETEKGD